MRKWRLSDAKFCERLEKLVISISLLQMFTNKMKVSINEDTYVQTRSNQTRREMVKSSEGVKAHS